jgi:hypothetical protein
MVLFILSVLLSYYSLIAFQSLVKLENKNTATTFYWVFDFFITVVSLASTVFFYSNEGKASKLFNYLAFAGVSWMITKILINIVMVLGDGFRLLEFASNWISLKFNSTENQPVFLESRRRFVGHVALMVASVPLTGLLYGMMEGKYDFKIHKETLYFHDLRTKLKNVYGTTTSNPDAYFRRSLLNFTSGFKSDILFVQGLNDAPIQMYSWSTFKQEVLSCRSCRNRLFVEITGGEQGSLFESPTAKTEFNNFINSH